jgi:septation ring formation regulator EzrA
VLCCGVVPRGWAGMGKRMRMTLPKKEEDLQKVVEEVMETHEHDHHHHHHHHHVEGLDEILHTIDVLMDTMNTRISDLEEKSEKLKEEIVNLYMLFAELVKAIAAKSDEEKARALSNARKIIEKGLSGFRAAE